MIGRILIPIGVATVFLLALCVSCYALRTTLQPSQTAIISNPSDTSDVRLLIQYELPESLASARILYAQLNGNVEVSASRDDPMLNVEALPLTTRWNRGSVSWTEPWTDSGGDLDISTRSSFLVRGGVQQVRIDVTRLVIDWVDGERANLGVMLRASDSFGGAFRVPTSAGEGTGSPIAPVVKVWYLPAIE